MTYDLTPRADRLERLYAARDRIDREIRRLLDAETDDPPDEPTATTTRRHNAARRELLRWAATPEFRLRVATYGRASGGLLEEAS